MKQTAVEWLQEEYDNNPESFLTEDDFNQAKEMEKEQIMRTARQCYFEGVRKRNRR